MEYLFKIIGALGVVIISVGILKKRKPQDIYFIIGGLFLEAYSIYIKDPIFIILQIIFISSASYDFIKARKIKN